MNSNKNNSQKKSGGVYFSLLVSEQDAEKLNVFAQERLGLDMQNSGNEYENRKHSTVFASKESNQHVDYQKIVEEQKDHSIKVTPIGWKLIKSHNSGKTCLALIINSQELMKSHEDIKQKTGLKHAFSDFITHISIHYDFELSPERLKDMPLPDFDITLDRLFTKDYKNHIPPKTGNHNVNLNHVKINKIAIHKDIVTKHLTTKKYKLVSNIKSIRDKFIDSTHLSSLKPQKF